MASARINQIADALVAELNAGEWGMQLDAWREYVRRLKVKEDKKSMYPRKDLSVLRVPVSPATRASTQLSRIMTQSDHVLEVCFWKAVPHSLDGYDRNLVDALVDLVERIERKYSDKHRLATMSTARPMSAETDPVFDEEFLRNDAVFASRMLIAFEDHV